MDDGAGYQSLGLSSLLSLSLSDGIYYLFILFFFPFFFFPNAFWALQSCLSPSPSRPPPLRHPLVACVEVLLLAGKRVDLSFWW